MSLPDDTKDENIKFECVGGQEVIGVAMEKCGSSKYGVE